MPDEEVEVTHAAANANIRPRCAAGWLVLAVEAVDLEAHRPLVIGVRRNEAERLAVAFEVADAPPEHVPDRPATSPNGTAPESCVLIQPKL